MVHMVVAVREIGRLKLEYALNFELPEVPRVGEYISIQRPDVRAPLGEDLIVRRVWWRLAHPATGGGPHENESIGRVTEIIVECDTALGPYASEAWGQRVQAARVRGVEVEEFDVDRGLAQWGRGPGSGFKLK